MDRFEAMGLFVAVADCGGYSAASRRTGVAVSTLSRKVMALEEHLETRLFARNTKGLSLTEKGREYHFHCKKVLADVEEAEAALSSDTLTVSGTLRVSAPAILGRLHVARLAGGFLLRHPKLKVELSLNDSFVDLVNDGFDMAVRTGDLSDSSVIARRIGMFSRILCCSPEYLEKHGPFETPSDLEKADCLIFTRLPHPDEWSLINASGGSQRIKVKGRIAADSADALYSAALDGVGVILTPTWQAGSELKEGTLVRILPEWTTTAVPIHVLFPHAKLLSGKVRAFADACVAYFRNLSNAC